MNKEFVTIIKDFVDKAIAEGSEYVWLTNLDNYGTMFKTNQLNEATAASIVDILDGARFGDDIKSMAVNTGNCVDIIVAEDNETVMYFLYDYTQGVIESV